MLLVSSIRLGKRRANVRSGGRSRILGGMWFLIEARTFPRLERQPKLRMVQAFSWPRIFFFFFESCTRHPEVVALGRSSYENWFRGKPSFWTITLNSVARQTCPKTVADNNNYLTTIIITDCRRGTSRILGRELLHIQIHYSFNLHCLSVFIWATDDEIQTKRSCTK